MHGSFVTFFILSKFYIYDAPCPEISEIQDQHALDSASAPVEQLNNSEQVTVAACAEESSVVEEVEPVQETTDVAPKELQAVVEPSNLVQEEPVKQTYASIVSQIINLYLIKLLVDPVTNILRNASECS